MKIQISLNPTSVANAITQIENYKKKLNNDLLEVARQLAEYGTLHASGGFASAAYDGTNDVTVDYEKTARGYKIVAHGNAVCFIEFGAGVYWNGLGGSYPGDVPPDIVGIGEYGKGQGKRRAWGFYDGGGIVITHGNPPNAVMYRTKKELINELPRIAKEVFNK